MDTNTTDTVEVNTEAEETVEGDWVATRSETIQIHDAEETVSGVWTAT